MNAERLAEYVGLWEEKNRTMSQEFQIAKENLGIKRRLSACLKEDYKREKSNRDLMIQQGLLAASEALPVSLLHTGA
jgi:hypothetical protein